MRRIKIGAAGLAGIMLASLASCSMTPDGTHARFPSMCAGASEAALRSYDPLAMGPVRGGYAAVANLSGQPDWKRTEASLRMLSLAGIPISETNLELPELKNSIHQGLTAPELDLSDLERISNVNQIATVGVGAEEFDSALKQFVAPGGYGWSADAERAQAGSNAIAARVISTNGLNAPSASIEIIPANLTNSAESIINEGVPYLIAREHFGTELVVDAERVVMWHETLVESLPSPIAIASIHDLHELEADLGFDMPAVPEELVQDVVQVGQVLASIDGRTPEFGITADFYELTDKTPNERLLASIVRTSNANGWQPVTSFNDLEATYHAVSLLSSCGYDAPLSSDFIKQVLSVDGLDPRSALMACELAKKLELSEVLADEEPLEKAASGSSVYAFAAASQCDLEFETDEAPNAEYLSMADVFRDGSSPLSNDQREQLEALGKGDGSAVAYDGLEQSDLVSSVQAATLHEMPADQRGPLIEKFTCDGSVNLLAPSSEETGCGPTTLAYWHMAIDFVTERDESHFAWTVPMRST